MNERNAVSVVLILVSFLCVSGSRAAERIQQLPSAAEVFHLRALCAKLGEQLSDENAIGSASQKIRFRITIRNQIDATSSYPFERSVQRTQTTTTSIEPFTTGRPKRCWHSQKSRRVRELV